MVFNGEIYNYLELRATLAAEHGAVFSTEGDGEAILAAYHFWGPDALHRLRGMFAFAIWDTVERELFCARDPFGIKPLFMATGPGGTALGSEKKCLLDLVEQLGIGTELDLRALQHYTTLQYVPEPESLHTEIRRLESGSYARIAPDRSRASRATSRPDSRWPRSRVPRVSPGTTRSPRCSPIRWPSICART